MIGPTLLLLLSTRVLSAITKVKYDSCVNIDAIASIDAIPHQSSNPNTATIPGPIKCANFCNTVHPWKGTDEFRVLVHIPEMGDAKGMFICTCLPLQIFNLTSQRRDEKCQAKCPGTREYVSVNNNHVTIDKWGMRLKHGKDYGVYTCGNGLGLLSAYKVSSSRTSTSSTTLICVSISSIILQYILKPS